jgi:hypothetical protein
MNNSASLTPVPNEKHQPANQVSAANSEAMGRLSHTMG